MFPGIVSLIGVDQIVRFQQYLVVRPVHLFRGVVVAHQVDHPSHTGLMEAAALQERTMAAASKLIWDISSTPSHWPMVLA